jgi:hypothetical protein
MPTLTTVLEATPICPRTVTGQRRGFAAPPTTVCAERLRYHAIGNDWRCPTHGKVLTGQALVLRAAGYACDDAGEVRAA